MTARSALPAPARRPAHPRVGLLLRGAVIALVIAALAVVFLVLPGRQNDRAAKTADSANPVTPGVFTGLGFDQCLAPTQAAMTKWTQSSPFQAVGIYISGDSRACRDQPNLTSQWVSTQLANGWHLLPITLGPQASCQPRFPRYDDDVKIKPGAANDYAKARAQGTAEATKTVAAAQALGIVPGSTMFYDIEGFDYNNVACRESALRFLSTWTTQLHALGYRSGVYSSAGSGMKLLERQRVSPLANIELPDQIWLARYDNTANTSASDYFSDDGWQGNRIKQFQGGHNETWGGVTINIDRNYLDLRSAPATTTAVTTTAARTGCNGRVVVDLPAYRGLKPATATYTPDPTTVNVLKCLLHEKSGRKFKLNGLYDAKLVKNVKAWRKARGLRPIARWAKKLWPELLSQTATTARE
ncbi:glycoside hydrolase domain-containing protein [Nocardioides sp.]|uniref:glycoside hydrolase domain-containing protein n=1 Tax=Nocardioides sp. TaxID=35761 RepID=UPI0039E661D1